MSYKIIQKQSPNYSSRAGSIPDMIVNHITAGSYSGAVSWLCNKKSQASAHFVVSKKGEITQLVSLKHAAWANGTSPYSDSVYYNKLATNPIVKSRTANANCYTISIEHEGYTADNGILTNEQLKASIWLHKHIISEVKKIYGITIPVDSNHIIGHCHISPKRKASCPGKQFPYDKIIKSLKDRDSISNNTAESTITHATSIKPGMSYNLQSVKLYTNYSIKNHVKVITGKYYIYDGKKFGTRYRITNSLSKVGKYPAASYVVGYIEEKDLK